MTEARLKECANGIGQRLSAAFQGMNLRLQAGIYLRSLAAGPLSLDQFFLLLFWLDLSLNQRRYLRGKRLRLN